jgi:hypothetical protein
MVPGGKLKQGWISTSSSNSSADPETMLFISKTVFKF